MLTTVISKIQVLHTFVRNKSFGQLLGISPKNFIFLKAFDSEFLYVEVWFTDQDSKPLEIEDKINIKKKKKIDALLSST